MRKCALREFFARLRHAVKPDSLPLEVPDMKKQKTPEELTTEFEIWKKKKDSQLLKLYQEKDAKEKAGKDISTVRTRLDELQTEIAQKKAQLDRRLVQLYAQICKAGASSDAKKERQERTHHLCNLGGLVEKAGLGGLEPAALLGMLLQQADVLASHPGEVATWIERGQAALNAGTEQVLSPFPAPERIELIVKHPREDDGQDKDAAKTAGARWDGTKSVWYVSEGFDLRRVEPWLPTEWKSRLAGSQAPQTVHEELQEQEEEL